MSNFLNKKKSWIKYRNYMRKLFFFQEVFLDFEKIVE